MCSEDIYNCWMGKYGDIHTFFISLVLIRNVFRLLPQPLQLLLSRVALLPCRCQAQNGKCSETLTKLFLNVQSFWSK